MSFAAVEFLALKQAVQVTCKDVALTSAANDFSKSTFLVAILGGLTMSHNPSTVSPTKSYADGQPPPSAASNRRYKVCGSLNVLGDTAPLDFNKWVLNLSCWDS